MANTEQLPEATIDLSLYTRDGYVPGASFVKRIVWYFVNILFFQNPLNVSVSIKVFFLKFFGTRVGKGVVIKPSVNIKYPWLLSVGDNVWIGENVWIDNLTQVTIGANVCLSQGALLLTGNHNYTSPAFDLLVKEIVLEDGVWIGAKAVVCPGVTCRSHSVLTVGSVATRELAPYGIYQGNPAQKIKHRHVYQQTFYQTN